MDLCGLEDGVVVFERSIETVEVAKDPEILMDAIRDFGDVDLIAGPSGYGIEITRLSEIPIERLEDWYYRYILLTTGEDIERGMERGFVGAFIYYSMVKTIVRMREENLPVVFIPGVINLPTVPEFKKVNKVDMGTADKMSVTVLGVYDQSRRLEIPYSDVSFILVEMGFGYNAVIGVKGGKIVDGFGGTTMLGPGFLTISYVDQEVVQLARGWEKSDIFVGGCSTISGRETPEEFVECVDEDDRCRLAWDAMFDGIEKAVAALNLNPKEILVSGRLVRIERVYGELTERLSTFAPVRRVGMLEGARITKETSQGYAIVADGIAGGKFKELIRWMEIDRAKGTCLDYIYHPKVRSMIKK